MITLDEKCLTFLNKCKDDNNYRGFENFVLEEIKSSDKEIKIGRINIILSLIKDNPYVQFTKSILNDVKNKLA